MWLSDSELEELLRGGESDRVEYKASVGDGEAIRRTLCAFANDLPEHRLPGVLFIGVDDNGTPVNLSVTDDLLRRLSDMRSDGSIVPFPTMTVERKRLCGAEVVVIQVQPADAPPIRYRGRVWVRLGPSVHIASPQEERQLAERRRAQEISFDIRPLHRVPLDILDERLFKDEYLRASVASDILQVNQRDLVDQMVSLRLAQVCGDGTVCPTVLGVLIIGKNPTEYLPGAYIQFCRFDGTSLTDPTRSTKELHGPLCRLLPDLDELLKIHINTATVIGSSLKDSRIPDYPLIALQQITRNAILHRSYEATNAPVRIFWFDDRVEIQSPGGPYGQVTRENFGQQGITDYRNPYLAEAMKNLGYVQRFGIGIALARKAMEDNKNPPPDFCVERSHVAVILRRRT